MTNACTKRRLKGGGRGRSQLFVKICLVLVAPRGKPDCRYITGILLKLALTSQPTMIMMICLYGFKHVSEVFHFETLRQLRMDDVCKATAENGRKKSKPKHG